MWSSPAGWSNTTNLPPPPPFASPPKPMAHQPNPTLTPHPNPPHQVLLRKPNSSMMDHFYIPPGVFVLRMLSFILSFALQVGT